MSEYITKIVTAKGLKQIDYNALANLPDIHADTVCYTEQTLTDEQKAQARENIGATTIEEVLATLPIYDGEVEDV